jgi:hypothetical protein
MIVVRQCYFARPVYRVRGRLTPGPERRLSSERDAVEVARRLARGKAGAVAFAMTGDPLLGIWDDAEVLASFGVTA